MGELALFEQAAAPETPTEGVVFYTTVATPSLARYKDDAGNDWLLGSAGTWTPGVSFGGGVTGITYAAGTLGRWERHGQTIKATGYFTLTNKGSSTGVAAITGLPVAGLNMTNYYQPIYLRVTNLDTITTNWITGYVIPNTTTIALEYLAAGAVVTFTDAVFQNTTNVILTAVYEVA